MTIGQAIDLAKNGELKNLAVGKDSSTVLGFINLGLIELYKRFPLNVNEHIITLVDGQTIYDMPNDYMWIVSAYQEVDELVNFGEPYAQIPINEEDNPESLNTIGYSQVQIPVVATGAYISVIYVAAPTYFTIEQLEDRLPIPPQMIEAMLEYIAFKAHSTLPNSGQAENNLMYQRFEASCERILRLGMISSDDMDMKSRDLKGFV